MGSDEPTCSCEQESHGELGVIEDFERLARVAISPNHFRSDGSFKPGMFPPTHIATKGVSLIRVDKMSTGEIRETADAIAKAAPNPQQVRGVRICPTKALRQMVDERGRRLLCVFDDPVINHPTLPDIPAHAMALRSPNQDEADLLGIQKKLHDLFNGLVQIDDIHHKD